MKYQLRGIALILFGGLLCVASITADNFFTYASGWLWLFGILIGVFGLILSFTEEK